MSKKNEDEFYEDKNGYVRENNHSNAWHRKVAYHKIYLKNRKKYLLPFSKYEIHHIDGDKKNNLVENLALLTTEEHIDLHQIVDKTRCNGLSWREACSYAWCEFTIEKEAKREKEYLDSLESKEEVYEYLLEKAGVKFEDGSIGLLMNENEGFIKEVLTFYQVTKRQITKKEIREIVGNKEGFKTIIKEQKKKKKKKVKKRHKYKSDKKSKVAIDNSSNWRKYFFIGIIMLAIIFVGYLALNGKYGKITPEYYEKVSDFKEGWSNERYKQICESAFGKERVLVSGGIPNYDFLSCGLDGDIVNGVRIVENHYLDLLSQNEISEKEVSRRRLLWNDFLGDIAKPIKILD